LKVPLLALANVHSARIFPNLVGYSVYIIFVFENIGLDGSKRQDGQNFVIRLPRLEMEKDRMGEACRKHVKKSTKYMARKRLKKSLELAGVGVTG